MSTMCSDGSMNETKENCIICNPDKLADLVKTAINTKGNIMESHEFYEMNKLHGNLRHGFQTPDEIEYLLAKEWTEPREIRQFLIAVSPENKLSSSGYPLPNGNFYPTFGHKVVYGWLNHGNLQGAMIDLYKKDAHYNGNNEYMLATWLELDMYSINKIAMDVAMDLQLPSKSLYWNASTRLVDEDLTAMELAKDMIAQGFKVFYTCDYNLTTWLEKVQTENLS